MTTTRKQLDELAQYVNKITNSPTSGDGSHKIYDKALVKIVNDDGAIVNVVSAYGKSKNELYDRIQCFIHGITYLNRN